MSMVSEILMGLILRIVVDVLEAIFRQIRDINEKILGERK